MLIEFNPKELQTSETNLDDFFNFIQKFTIREVTKNGLIEPDFDKLRKNVLATNLFLY